MKMVTGSANINEVQATFHCLLDSLDWRINHFSKNVSRCNEDIKNRLSPVAENRAKDFAGTSIRSR